MFFCDPPGDTSATALFNFGDDVTEHNYIWLHDQEPVDLNIHSNLFGEVVRRNRDLNHGQGPLAPILVSSERDSDFVRDTCDQFGWHPFYYFFHGWAALDWYRGYDRTWLMTEPQDRDIKKSFFSANRIIGGQRQHRVHLMLHLLRSRITNAVISFPRVCPVEQLDIVDICRDLGEDAVEVFTSVDLPWCFPGESDHPMHSCWLSLFDENAQSLAHVVTETVFYGRRHHLTEKTFKPICLKMPFIMVSTAHSLAYLRSYGFRTFDSVWSEAYDQEEDDQARLEKIARLLKDLDEQSPRELNKIYQATIPIIEHNFNHFYRGGFEKILWQEFTTMLDSVKKHVQAH